MRRPDVEVALQNIPESVGIRKGLKKRTSTLLLQYPHREANQGKTQESQSLWRSAVDKRTDDCLNCSALHNYGGQRAYNSAGDQKELWEVGPQRLPDLSSLPLGTQAVGECVDCEKTVSYHLPPTNDRRAISPAEAVGAPVSSLRELRDA